MEISLNIKSLMFCHRKRHTRGFFFSRFLLIFLLSACADALGMEDVHIPDKSIISSSHWASSTSRHSRLFMNSGYSWMPGLMDRNSFLQIEIDKTDHVITGVASQGYRSIPAAVVKFQLSFSRDGLHWFYYKEDGEIRVKVNFFPHLGAEKIPRM